MITVYADDRVVVAELKRRNLYAAITTYPPYGDGKENIFVTDDVTDRKNADVFMYLTGFPMAVDNGFLWYRMENGDELELRLFRSAVIGMIRDEDGKFSMSERFKEVGLG